MGNVWAARLKGTRGFRKLVAVKTILRSFENPNLEQMLFREATLASQIHHPNVVETIELGEHQGIMYLAMELIHGESLGFVVREAHTQGCAIPLGIAVNIVGQVCKGLQSAHELCDDEGNRIGLIHRDITPPNILVTYSGTVKIVDFGVATTTTDATLGSGEIKGKVSYLAPEQLKGEALDARVDIFTTGIVLYLLTVGRHPFKAPTDGQTIARILSDQPATPPSAIVEDYPEALEAVVLRALAKDRDERYSSAGEFLDALSAAMPEAFGSNSEKVVSDYLQELLKTRMLERRATLRMAESLAETSSPRSSVISLPAVATTEAPTKASRTRTFATAAAVFLSVAAALVVSPRYFPRIQQSFAPEPVVVAEREQRTDRISVAALRAPAAEAPSMIRDALPLSTAALTPVVAASVARARDVAPAAAATERRSTEKPDKAGPAAEPSTPEPVVTSPSGEPSVLDVALAPPSEAHDPALHESPALVASAENASAVPFIAFAPKPLLAEKQIGPRQLSSKVAHARLTIDPTDERYRVKLPPALERSGRTVGTTVKICVSPSGTVTSVEIKRSAGGSVDAQIPRVLARWQYKPLIENGAPVPFCYPLRYEIVSR